MLQVEKLNQYYGESHTLWDVELYVPEGVCTCLMGRNGVGKTTLLKSLMGLVPVKTGRITLDGRDVTRDTPYARARAGLAIVPQGREIFGRLTLEENLRMCLAARPGGTAIPHELFELFDKEAAVSMVRRILDAPPSARERFPNVPLKGGPEIP